MIAVAEGESMGANQRGDATDRGRTITDAPGITDLTNASVTSTESHKTHPRSGDGDTDLGGWERVANRLRRDESIGDVCTVPDD